MNVEDEKPPDTEPVPTPAFAPGEPASPARGPTKGKKYGMPSKPRKPGTPGLRSIDELVRESEQADGKVQPERVVMILKAYRSLELTIRAQRDLIQKLGRENAELKKVKR